MTVTPIIPNHVDIKNGTSPIPRCGHKTFTTQCGGNGAILGRRFDQYSFGLGGTVPDHDQERDQVRPFRIDLLRPFIQSGLPRWQNEQRGAQSRTDKVTQSGTTCNALRKNRSTSIFDAHLS